MKYEYINGGYTRVRTDTLEWWRLAAAVKPALPRMNKRKRGPRRNSRVRRRDRYWAKLNGQRAFREAAGI